MCILGALTVGAFYLIVGPDFVKSVFQEGYEALISPMAILFSNLLIIIFIPSLYLASKVVKDRPFSSYSSSHGGWNAKLYFKAFIIPLIMYILYLRIDTANNFFWFICYVWTAGFNFLSAVMDVSSGIALEIVLFIILYLVDRKRVVW